MTTSKYVALFLCIFTSWYNKNVYRPSSAKVKVFFDVTQVYSTAFHAFFMRTLNRELNGANIRFVYFGKYAASSAEPRLFTFSPDFPTYRTFPYIFLEVSMGTTLQTVYPLQIS